MRVRSIPILFPAQPVSLSLSNSTAQSSLEQYCKALEGDEGKWSVQAKGELESSASMLILECLLGTCASGGDGEREVDVGRTRKQNVCV